MESIKITDKDYFRWGTPHQKLMKKTILNSYTACLKRCDWLIREMEKRGETLFKDPDYGP